MEPGLDLKHDPQLQGLRTVQRASPTETVKVPAAERLSDEIRGLPVMAGSYS